ncbi:hypothetical protein ARALYDRAFT_324165 [Arabidopsis lyrata subsp. lyrata]|uniref:F-box domain-containing protein n=1 Tax=Arabidopsis lyrata subsp. lyrata TaxID=81972 RepID=D7LVG9_ARALL|nr:hypothetical protein ARALYDRAFT_324165 [Arabidopsis lyrata subsp. lyrata]
MKRGREEKSDETSPSPTQLGHGGISTRDINIPIDLTVEILKKLPAKSLVKFQCVSKQWSAIISRRRDFIDSIVTRSLTQPPPIYNPTTRRSFHLPKSIKTSSTGTCFFGYDPLENQYKILFLPLYYLEQGCQMSLSVGWCNLHQWDDSTSIYMLMSFDVRTEKFCHVDAPNTLMDHFSFLINYQGKLGFVCCGKSVEIWVREDGHQKTQIWSKLFFYEMEGFEKWRVSGVTRGGEIVFVNTVYFSDDKLCVLYYDPKRNSIIYVDFEGIYSKERRRHNSVLIWTLPDHVENTMRLY